MKYSSFAVWAALLSFSCSENALSSVAAEPRLPIPEHDVSIAKIKSIFDAAKLRNEIDKDGDIVVRENDLNVFVEVDREKKFVTLLCAFPLRKSVPEIEKLRLVNRCNGRLIFVRFSMLGGDALWCDYQFTFERELSPYNVIYNYNRFAGVVNAAVATVDFDGIIGTDPVETVAPSDDPFAPRSDPFAPSDNPFAPAPADPFAPATGDDGNADPIGGDDPFRGDDPFLGDDLFGGNGEMDDPFRN